MVGLITVTGCGRAALLGARAKQMHLPHLAIVNQNCEHMASFFGDRDSMFASYIEVKDVEVIITRMKDDGFTHILVLYDEKFALYGLELLKRQAERTNLTFSFLRLIPDWNRFKESIKTIFKRQAEKNSLYTGFGVLVFSNYTCAEKLEADLISEKIMDPNIILVVFYNGWDENLSRWYYTHGIGSPYEKLIYVIVRSFPKRVMHRMKRASRLLNGKYHVVLMEHWGFRRNEATYRLLLLSPVQSNTTRMRHIQDWTIANGTVKTTFYLDKVSAFLKNRTIKVASLEDIQNSLNIVKLSIIYKAVKCIYGTWLILAEPDTAMANQ
ncbi:hypothetical protein HPB47_021175 [Ixodes persulcatus]|uniref:Uncharacterized protein n=1 Tax=Ixodes persulcatus TaxID=34615 RepID=A0AC60QDA8_IXOPE|nr:hypothetical protein HPB47_021175 [Ixodes persulcatus]